MRATLIYDAECRLCVNSKKMIEKWDRKQRIRFLPFQSEEARIIDPGLAGLARIDAMRFVEKDRPGAVGPVAVGIDAFRRMLPMLPFGRILSGLFYLPGVSWLARKTYRVIAKNRILWFGSCPSKQHKCL